MPFARRLVFNRLCLVLLGLLLATLPAVAQNPASEQQQSSSYQVSVTGIVKKPGLYVWHCGLSVLELLAACGGPTVAPERTLGTLVTRFGVKMVPINLGTLLVGADPSQNRLLLPGDTLTIKAAKTGGQVQVIGQVVRPGLYTVPVDGLSLIAVLTEAGGPSPDAALSRAQVRHENTFKTINLRPFLNGQSFPVQDLRLFPGDWLSIPECGRVVVSGAVRHGGVFSMPDGGLFTVSDALALAGGLITDSDAGKIVIVRHRYGRPAEDIRAELKDELMAGDRLFVAVPPNLDKAMPRLVASASPGDTP